MVITVIAIINIITITHNNYNDKNKSRFVSQFRPIISRGLLFLLHIECGNDRESLSRLHIFYRFYDSYPPEPIRNLVDLPYLSIFPLYE